MPRASLIRTLVALSVPAPFAVAHAQCPDGTPPPCRGAAPAGSARRETPALNERAWIVVPFTNVTKAPDLDWFRDASVNLLTLDPSRWTDISVVDDERVTDLLRKLPAARVTKALSLGDGLALARRAGAGNPVMGDFVKIGWRTRLVANVFDAKRAPNCRAHVASTSSPGSGTHG